MNIKNFNLLILVQFVPLKISPFLNELDLMHSKSFNHIISAFLFMLSIISICLCEKFRKNGTKQGAGFFLIV